ncbi:phosphatidylinositol N-acetylglucosaminyltransferase subunit Q [Ctenocephalides felis]|uniref:phosphatidylinositol N-acetylglucosaminyltransferase subunit Q n=1 Tax=Ctenocephalides felis TaxID=7515 RepID=UPI000E6E2AD8|nr:phosphatidylinositol N-acetylglucosaminyltransferase subunit Q [Ctenocephalides felis]
MIIGFDSVDKIKPNNKINFCTPNFISISQSDAEEWHICIQDVKLRNRMLPSSIQPIVVYYDYNAFLIAYIDNNNFETSKSSVKPYDHFATLSEFIKARKHEQTKRINNHGPAELIKKLVLQIFFISLLYISRFLNSVSIIGKYSAFYRNLKECINGIVEIHENGAKLQQRSLLITILADIAVGCFVLWKIKDIYQPVEPLLDGAEYIVMYLRELLSSLMGSPVGLKLNKAFNTMLGKCFLYHIELWWIFLVQLSPWICHSFNVLFCLGTLGISYQSAMICDIISLTTFHVHCIYVYAAKLYNIQVKGLKALWRLFLGRKYNPLRDRVDSCSYSNRQLFIGTLGFTIFLFLLPTTTLYYIVFTVLRIIMLVIMEVLDWIRELLHSMPIYTSLLWLFGSVAVPSTAHLESKLSNNIIHATAYPLSPLQHNRFIPPIIKHSHRMQWSGILGKIINGELLTQF